MSFRLTVASLCILSVFQHYGTLFVPGISQLFLDVCAQEPIHGMTKPLQHVPITGLKLTSPVPATSVGNPKFLFDDNERTTFNLGDYAPQSLTIDLGGSYDLSKIEFVVEQSPIGEATHQVYIAGTSSPFTLIGGWAKLLATGNRLELLTNSKAVRFVKIETVQSPSWVAWQEIRAYGQKTLGNVTGKACLAEAKSHLHLPKFFGYFASSAVYGDFAADVANHSNVVFVNVTSWGTCTGMPDVEKDIARIKSAKSHGLKVILWINGLFFDNKFQWNPFAEQCWNAYQEKMQPYASDIVAFYPSDEPFSNALFAAGLAVPSTNLTTAQHNRRKQIITATAANLSHAAQMIKSSFPTTKILMLFMGSEVSADDIPVPAAIDWIGFDCYGNFDLCPHSHRNIPDTLDILKAKLSPSQELVLIPDAFIPSPKGALPSLQEQLILVNIIERYMNLASDYQVTGVFPFLWHRLDGGPKSWDLVGMKYMQEIVQKKYKEYGKCVKTDSNQH